MEVTVTSASSRHPGASVLLRACGDRLGVEGEMTSHSARWSDAFMLVPGGPAGWWGRGREGWARAPLLFNQPQVCL